MPFTLAHPIIVLPIARRLPKFPFSALVIGSMTPDFTHFIALRWNEYQLAHSIKGVCTLDLAVGLLTYVVFHNVLKFPLLALLPPRDAALLTPIAAAPRPARVGFWIAVIIALLVGSLTHIALDDCTHGYGFVVQHIALLRANIPGTQLPVFRSLQYGISVLGMVGLATAYSRWRKGQPIPHEPYLARLRPIPTPRQTAAGLAAAVAFSALVATVFTVHFRHDLRPGIHLRVRRLISDVVCSSMATAGACALTYSARWHLLRARTIESANG